MKQTILILFLLIGIQITAQKNITVENGSVIFQKVYEYDFDEARNNIITAGGEMISQTETTEVWKFDNYAIDYRSMGYKKMNTPIIYNNSFNFQALINKQDKRFRTTISSITTNDRNYFNAAAISLNTTIEPIEIYFVNRRGEMKNVFINTKKTIN